MLAADGENSKALRQMLMTRQGYLKKGAAVFFDEPGLCELQMAVCKDGTRHKITESQRAQGVPFMSLSNSEDMENRYISSSENANLLLMTAFSQIGRNISGNEARFCHNQNVGQYETIWAKMPWGSGSMRQYSLPVKLVVWQCPYSYLPKDV